MNKITSIPVVKLNNELFVDAGIEVSVLRLDLCDPLTGGNKWFKLNYNLKKFKEENYGRIISFGGPYSNHIAALARACKQLGIPVTGIIRGEKADTITLHRAQADGMQLLFTDRSSYRRYRDTGSYDDLIQHFGNVYIIPEGGGNIEGYTGCKEITSFFPENITHVYLPVGTGTTMAGLIAGNASAYNINGILVVNDHTSVRNKIIQFLIYDNVNSDNWTLNDQYIFGGYAKPNAVLNQFVESFRKDYSIPIEPVYTGRAFYAFFDTFKKGNFKRGDAVLLLHTGGLQYLLS